MSLRDSKAIAQFIKNAANDDDILLKSEGKQLYSYIDVFQAAYAVLFIMLNGENGNAYNISADSGEWYMRELADMAASHAGKKVVFDLPDEKEINKNEIDKDAVYRSLKSIEFENITFGFDRDFILDNTSLSINKGDFVAIMGISGIGKSTLLKLLLGVLNVNSGSIYLNTDNSKIFIDKNTRKLFSYVPQGNMLISGTIKDNITFINPSATDDEIAKAIEISCAKQFIDELPLGIETVIGEKGMGLSEGQIQRLAIARSLLANSPVLLLDEATSALDEQTEKQFLTNLKTLDNITCLIVSHKKAALDICNKSIKIKNGKIISEG